MRYIVPFRYMCSGDFLGERRGVCRAASELFMYIKIYGGWAHRDVAIAWFRAGLPFLHGVMTTYPACLSLSNDKEIFLLVAEHCVPDLKKESNLSSSQALRNNKEFMTKVLAKDASLFLCASTELKHDFDFVTLAFASSPEIIKEYMEEQNEVDLEFLIRVSEHTQSHLATHEACIQTLLWCRCRFQQFDLSLWKLILEYLGAQKVRSET